MTNIGDGLDPLRRRADFLERRLATLAPKSRTAFYEREELAALRRVLGPKMRPKHASEVPVKKEEPPDYQWPAGIVRGFGRPRLGPGME